MKPITRQSQFKHKINTDKFIREIRLKKKKKGNANDADRTSNYYTCLSIDNNLTQSQSQTFSSQDEKLIFVLLPNGTDELSFILSLRNGVLWFYLLE